MCGISLTVGYEDSVIEKMVLHQTKRGPDYSNWIKATDRINFGHNLLSIIGDQKQPLISSNQALGRVGCLTFNGAIYNYKDFSNNTNSDTVALAELLLIDDFKDVLDRLNGQFAIGYLRGGKIYCAVDRFAQKPLFYYHDGLKFAAASTPAALTALKDKWELDREALDSYWLLGGVMTGSLFKGIKKLGASEMLTFDIATSELKIERYYEPKFQDNTNDIEDLVIDAIQKVKVADVPIHVFLSGGIDSTLVASQFVGGKAIHLESPEESYAVQVAKKFEIDLSIYSPGNNVENDLKDFCIESGQPAMAALIPYVTCLAMSEFGRVGITANGADELFFGYDRTHDGMSIPQTYHIFRNIGAPLKYLSDERCSMPQSSGRLLELSSYVQFDLNQTLDFASMARSVEMRAPFLDHRLVEMALSIPEHEHRKEGNKTILKRMLWRMGFDRSFTDRPKIGFSLHKQPTGMDKLISVAWKFVKEHGFLTVDDKKLSGRDRKYIEMSALVFYYWFQCWSDKLK